MLLRAARSRARAQYVFGLVKRHAPRGLFQRACQARCDVTGVPPVTVYGLRTGRTYGTTGVTRRSPWRLAISRRACQRSGMTISSISENRIQNKTASITAPPGCRVNNMTLRLGARGLDRFAGCANELSVCACHTPPERLVRLAPRTKIDREAQAFDSVLAERFA